MDFDINIINYNNIVANNPRIIFSRTPKIIKANIGERSIPYIGGTIFLQGAKKKLLKSAKNLNGCLYQSILGNQVKKQLTIKMKKVA